MLLPQCCAIGCPIFINKSIYILCAIDAEANKSKKGNFVHGKPIKIYNYY